MGIFGNNAIRCAAEVEGMDRRTCEHIGDEHEPDGMADDGFGSCKINGCTCQGYVADTDDPDYEE